MVIIHDLFYTLIFANSQKSFSTLQRHNTENLNQIFPEKELCGHSPSFHIHVSVSVLYIPTMLQKICGSILGTYKSLTECGIGTEAAQFPKKEYFFNEIFVAA
jgi:hypothetical protein